VFLKAAILKVSSR